eukprot:gene22529-25526_t
MPRTPSIQALAWLGELSPHGGPRFTASWASMASERPRKAAGWAAAYGSAAALMALSYAAAGYAGSPRMQVLCALAAIVPACLLHRQLRGSRTAPGSALPFTVVPAENAESARRSDGAWGLTPDRRALLAAAQVLEARLEHAPIALFSIAHLSGPAAGDPTQLAQLLAAQTAERRELVSFESERGTERALASVTALTVQGAGQRLAALMPVESELEAEAMNAWRQLVQVLTHEIMNSLTPVASLSRTGCDLLEEAKADLAPDVSGDLGTALDAIARRAASLVEFVASYRSLSSVPQARPERVHLGELFARLSMLMAPQWLARGGRAEFSVEPASLDVMVDPGQLEQALINLLKNAAEATAATPQPQLQVSARLSRGGRLRIEVSDNGPGVPQELAAHVFTPFFSTKKQGRGIGLAMVRHLVH